MGFEFNNKVLQEPAESIQGLFGIKIDRIQHREHLHFPGIAMGRKETEQGLGTGFLKMPPKAEVDAC